MVKFFHHTKNQDSVTPLTPKKGSLFWIFLFFWKPITFEPIKLGVCNLISLKLESSSFTIPKMKILWPQKHNRNMIFGMMKDNDLRYFAFESYKGSKIPKKSQKVDFFGDPFFGVRGVTESSFFV